MRRKVNEVEFYKDLTDTAETKAKQFVKKLNDLNYKIKYLKNKVSAIKGQTRVVIRWDYRRRRAYYRGPSDNTPIYLDLSKKTTKGGWRKIYRGTPYRATKIDDITKATDIGEAISDIKVELAPRLKDSLPEPYRFNNEVENCNIEAIGSEIRLHRSGILVELRVTGVATIEPDCVISTDLSNPDSKDVWFKVWVLKTNAERLIVTDGEKWYPIRSGKRKHTLKLKVDRLRNSELFTLNTTDKNLIKSAIEKYITKFLV